MSVLNTISPRVNSARMSDYIGRTVRLTGKHLQTRRDSNNGHIVLTLEASDGGKVEAHGGDGTAGENQTPFIEVIGSVEKPGVMALDAVINLGDNLDLTVVDFVVEKWHSPQFSAMLFPSQGE